MGQKGGFPWMVNALWMLGAGGARPLDCVQEKMLSPGTCLWSLRFSEKENRWKRFHSQSKKPVEWFHCFHCWTKRKMIKDQRNVCSGLHLKSDLFALPFLLGGPLGSPGRGRLAWVTSSQHCWAHAGGLWVSPASQSPYTPTPHCQPSERDTFLHSHRLSLSLQPRLRTHKV